MNLPIALQLYSIRNPLGEDFEGSLEQVAQFGYEYVELAGLYGRTPEQAKVILDRLGLKAMATHVGLGDIVNNMAGLIEQSKLFGFKYVVLPCIDDKFRKPSGYRELAGMLDKIAAAAGEAGLTVCYHNHNFEFEQLEDGSRGYDILFDTGEPHGYQAELDVYWAQKAGDDPLAWMKKLAGRVPLLHMKDMADTEQRGFTEIGRGVIDLKSIAEAAESCGVAYLIIEQDNHWSSSPLESAKVSIDNLKDMMVTAA